MNVGKTLFAQVMEFVPWKTFGWIIQRHRGDAGARTLGCPDLFRVMAFAQLTWRESLRDIKVCLAANRTKLFHMGLKNVPARSTEGIFAKQEYGPAGVRAIWGFAFPPYQLMMAQRRIAPLKEIEGAKIRTVGSSMEFLVRRLKGVPVKISAPDAYEALSRGTIDGVMLTHASLFAYKMEGLVKYATSSGSFGGTVGAYSISEKRWKELPAPIQKAIMDAGEKAARRLCAYMEQDAQEAQEKLRQRGVTMVTFSATEQKELEGIYAATASEWVTSMDKRGKPGSEALKAFTQALKAGR